ncbi:MAG: amidase, partial [Planctomyces sp.]
MHPVSVPQLLTELNSGALTSRQLVQSCLDRIARFNPQINAFVHVAAQTALEQADRIDAKRASGQPLGILAGLPVAVKDNICARNMPTTCGSRMLQNFTPPHSAHVIERIAAEDGILLGKLNLDEFAMGSSSETSIFGPVRNPWNSQLSAG